MSLKYQVGSIVEGKVVKLKPFGAIVALDSKTQGLVHISQVSDSFVRNISDYLDVGNDVKVKILSIDTQANKIALSIKEANPDSAQGAKGTNDAGRSRTPHRAGESTDSTAARPTDGAYTQQYDAKKRYDNNRKPNDMNRGRSSDGPRSSDYRRGGSSDSWSGGSQRITEQSSFDDKLKDWLKQSNERQTGLNKRNNKR